MLLISPMNQTWNIYFRRRPWVSVLFELSKSALPYSEVSYPGMPLSFIMLLKNNDAKIRANGTAGKSRER